MLLSVLANHFYGAL